MEFWGIEVKAGAPVQVLPDQGNVIHLSQACLGESKKAPDSVVIYGKVGEKELVLGHLIPGQIPQLTFDLVFDEEFELSHNWKSGSVHFAGYQSVMGDDSGSDDEFGSDSSDEEEDIPVVPRENGKVEIAKPTSAKSNAKPESPGKQKVKIEEPKDEADEDLSDSDLDDSMDSDDSADSVDGDESDDDSDEEDEETPTPKKLESKKRALAPGSAKTPVSAKKAKIVTATPQKTDGKKGGHTDTPHPAKKGKTPATDKSKAETPKSAGGNLSCNTCNKKFGSDGALQSHNKAKHSAGK